MKFNSGILSCEVPMHASAKPLYNHVARLEFQSEAGLYQQSACQGIACLRHHKNGLVGSATKEMLLVRRALPFFKNLLNPTASVWFFIRLCTQSKVLLVQHTWLVYYLPQTCPE